jgi:SAM-dependent methyltransferase
VKPAERGRTNGSRQHDRRYSKRFFEHQAAEVRRSAEEIVPIVLELVRPASVIDIGCGLGTWLSVLMEHGITDVYGIDGPYIDPDRLEIPTNKFEVFDLRNQLRLDRRFDLALCLEVGEHLPAGAATTLVDSLVALAPVVLFSAAIPYQGGLHHQNEQWPDYWAELFATHSYVPIDCIRPRIWSRPEVAFYYSQNMIMFARREQVALHEPLSNELSGRAPRMLAVVHPRLYLTGFDPSFRTAARLLKRSLTIVWRQLRG